MGNYQGHWVGALAALVDKVNAQPVNIGAEMSELVDGPDKDERNLNRLDFYSFVNEYDRRKGSNFLEIFPEYSEFYTVCKKTKLLLG